MGTNGTVESVFKTAAQKQRHFAMGASYAIGLTEPIVLTLGPTTKGGSIAVSNNAPWHIGSVSKSFTSTLVMRLVERGELELDVPISDYLSEYRERMHDDWKACTLRQLLSHTSGLVANVPKLLVRRTYTDTSDQGRRTVLSALWDQPKAAETGTFMYSNVGYVLVGLVCEIVTGSTWEELILTEIATPLGFKSLGFGAPQQEGAPLGHQSILGFKRPVAAMKPASDNPKWMGPAGTIHLSMSDLTKWGQVHMKASSGDQASFLSKESCQVMQTPVAQNYGLGWVIETAGNDGLSVWHNGSNTMWYTVLRMFPERQIAIAISTNVFEPQPIDAVLQDLSSQLLTSGLHR